MVDPFIDPDAEWRSKARARKLRRPFPLHWILAFTLVLLTAGGVLIWLDLQPTPEELLTARAEELETAWSSLPAEALHERFFTPGERFRRQMLRHFERRGWTELRPDVTLVDVDLHYGEDRGTARYRFEDQEERVLTVHFRREAGEYRISAYEVD